jgi:hypothetical protein
LHFCCLLLAACIMLHLARKANGLTWCAEGTSPISHEASRLLCVGGAEPNTHFDGLAAPASDRAAAPPGILNAPLPASATGPHSAPWTTPRPLPAPAPGTLPILVATPRDPAPGPSHRLPWDRAPSPYPRISAPTTRPRPRPPSLPEPGCPSPSPVRPPPSAHLAQDKVLFFSRAKDTRRHGGQGKGWRQVRFAPLPFLFRLMDCAILANDLANDGSTERRRFA